MPNSAARKPARIALKLLATACVCLALLSTLGSPSALAAGGSTCEGQIFTQAFALFGDSNWYLLTPGSQFSSGGEGWQLSGGAQIVESIRPYGLRGDVLELPEGAEAVSPPVCVDMNYETAKTWLRRTDGSGAVKVSVSYAGTRSETKPVKVASIHTSGAGWAAEAFQVEPGLVAGEPEEAREVRFVFEAHNGQATDYQMYGVYVDPRML
jgi:hypothetical protein